MFRITLNPGTVITFVAELATPELPQIYLWEPDAYKDTVNAFTLYRGIVLGIAGLLAVFLTILFVVKGTSMLPAAAALAWAVLAYICVDFGFLEKLISLTASDVRIWRAGAEVALASSLVIFLFTYLNLNRWHVHLGYATLAWMLGLTVLFGVAIFDPSVAAGIARVSFALTGVVGIGLIIYLGINRYDRAVLLVPTWALILVWLFGGWMTVTGQLDNDIIQPALGGGLVLIVLLIGFTVMQHAFAGGAYQQGLFSDLERQSLALTGSGDTVWDWDVARDRVVTSPDVSIRLGLSPGTMHGPARNWLPRLHPDDRDRFRATLDVLLEHRKGRLSHEFRIRAEDGHFHWLKIRARPVLGSNGEVIRCVGTIIDVTEQKNSIDRLLVDAMHDNLTGLPNREVFLDRLQAILSLASTSESVRPTVLAIDIDRYKQVNDALGIAAGDNILIAITRRLRRLLKPQDTLARLSGDEFGLILVSEKDPAKIADFADAVSKAIMVPLNFANREISLTASIGLVSWVDQQESAASLLADAELAMYRAKRTGGDQRRALPPGLPHRRHRSAAVRDGPAPRHRAQGTVDGLSADRQARQWRDCRLRGLDALGPPEARHDLADRVHSDRRNARSDRAARHVCAANAHPADLIGVVTARPASCRSSSRSTCRRPQLIVERDLPTTSAPSLAQTRLRTRAAQAGTHRKRGHDDKLEQPRRIFERAEGDRRAAGARRFRHRLFGAGLSHPLPLRHDQARQGAGLRPVGQEVRPPALRGLDGARARHAGGGRGHPD